MNNSVLEMYFARAASLEFCSQARTEARWGDKLRLKMKLSDRPHPTYES